MLIHAEMNIQFKGLGRLCVCLTTDTLWLSWSHYKHCLDGRDHDTVVDGDIWQEAESDSNILRKLAKKWQLKEWLLAKIRKMFKRQSADLDPRVGLIHQWFQLRGFTRGSWMEGQQKQDLPPPVSQLYPQKLSKEGWKA